MKNNELYNESAEATFCMEDNKLRLYVGRVPREEFLELRKEGWTSTPKQDCDFVATWTPQRQDTAESYAAEVGDEDQSPADRAADRAERFAGYRDKRTAEATGHADAYDQGPAAHGYQDKGKAAKAAERHDRHASRALNQWSKADYWTTRTQGVIQNALYLSRPSVRMGRIKKLQTELRRYEASPDYYERWTQHTQNRLAYEELMLEAVGGRAAVVEMEKGGTYAGNTIARVIKSKASGEVTSLKVIHQGKEHHKDIQRDKAGAYEPPTDESKAELAQFLKDRAAAAKERNKGKPKLINPTADDALKIQELWNDEARARHGDKATPQIPIKLTQAAYSAHSKGSYAQLETIEIRQGGLEQATHYGTYKAPETVPTLCKVRVAPSEGGGWTHGSAKRVVHIVDKPAKPLPAAIWEPCPIATARAEVTPEALKEIMPKIHRAEELTEEETKTAAQAKLAGFIGTDSHNRDQLTRAGHAHLPAYKPA